MEDITVSCKGVVKLLKNLKPHKAAGPDDIPLMLHREAADEIAPAITLLFQASLYQGNTPSTWRKALVPISLLLQASLYQGNTPSTWRKALVPITLLFQASLDQGTLL